MKHIDKWEALELGSNLELSNMRCPTMPTQSYPHTATIVNTVVAPPCEPPSYVRRRRRRPVVGRIRKAMSRSFQAYTSSLLVEMPLDWGASSQCKDHDHKHAHHSEASADRAVFLQDTFCIRASSAAAAAAGGGSDGAATADGGSSRYTYTYRTDTRRAPHHYADVSSGGPPLKTAVRLHYIPALAFVFPLLPFFVASSSITVWRNIDDWLIMVWRATIGKIPDYCNYFHGWIVARMLFKKPIWRHKRQLYIFWLEEKNTNWLI